jgi:hypothetical protein
MTTFRKLPMTRPKAVTVTVAIRYGTPDKSIVDLKL